MSKYSKPDISGQWNTTENNKHFEIKATSWTNGKRSLCASPDSPRTIVDVTSSLDSLSEIARLEPFEKQQL